MEQQPLQQHLNVHKQHSDLPIDSKQRAYSEADDLVVGGPNQVQYHQADANKSVERCNELQLFLIDIHLDFNQSHISYNGDGEYSSRLAPATIGLHNPHGGVSTIEVEEIAKEEYERVLEDLRHQEGVTDEDVRNFEKTAIIQKSLYLVKERANLQKSIRSSNGGAYTNVKSKVARCLKVQKKVAKDKKKANKFYNTSDSQ